MVRQLTAIMFTDMVGYTALMQENEQQARDQRSRQRSVLEASIGEHGGQVLEVHGDGTLSTFPSAVQAVLSAVEIQKELMMEPQVPLRIGVHTGDIIHDADGVFGDGVNVASRIQACAAPGGILISAKVFDEVKNQPEIQTRSLGEFALKNVKRPTEVYAVVGNGLALPDAGTLAALRGQEYRSVAVLPLVNLSSDPENEFFGDGIAEEIINALTRVNGLQVTARTSSFAYKGRSEDVRQIAVELGVTTILEGSVRRSGNRVRIAVQLIDARNGYHLFSEVYDRSLDDIFETQDEIARTVLRELEKRLTAPGKTSGREKQKSRPLVSPQTQDMEAYTEYLRGLECWRRWTTETVREAIVHYERSIEIDDQCALPYTGLATAYIFLGAVGHMALHEAYPRAEAAARRAVELAEGVGESHAALAAVQLFYKWDFDGAYRSIQKALSLTPGSAEVRHLYAMYLMVVGDPEAAVEELETAVQSDPLSLTFNQELGRAYFTARRLDEAVSQLRLTLELDPSFRAASETLGLAHWARGEYEAAWDKFQRVINDTGNPYHYIPHRALVLAAQGRMDEANAMEALLARRKLEQPDVMLDIDSAILMVALGNTDGALTHLERAADLQLGGLIFMIHNPIWDPIRDDPRFGALMERIGLHNPVVA